MNDSDDRGMFSYSHFAVFIKGVPRNGASFTRRDISGSERVNYRGNVSLCRRYLHSFHGKYPSRNLCSDEWPLMYFSVLLYARRERFSRAAPNRMRVSGKSRRVDRARANVIKRVCCGYFCRRLRDAAASSVFSIISPPFGRALLCQKSATTRRKSPVHSAAVGKCFYKFPALRCDWRVCGRMLYSVSFNGFCNALSR